MRDEQAQYPGASRKWAALLARLGSIGAAGAVIAFSGGVDSSLLAYGAREAGIDPLLLLCFHTPLQGESQRQQASAMGRELGLPLHIEEANVLACEQVRLNQRQRCYYCKQLLYRRLAAFARAQGLGVMLEGSNADDLSQYRPGQAAGEEAGVERPLAEAGLTKGEIRALARAFGLSCHDAPSTPCLASRFPYDTELTAAALLRVERGEAFLRELGFRQCRLRSQGDLARLEVEPEMLPRLVELGQDIAAALRGLGYAYVTCDLEGFRSGCYDRTAENGV